MYRNLRSTFSIRCVTLRALEETQHRRRGFIEPAHCGIIPQVLGQPEKLDDWRLSYLRLVFQSLAELEILLLPRQQYATRAIVL